MTAQPIASEWKPRALPRTAGASGLRRWTGRILSAVLVLFFVLDGGMKLFKPPAVVQATVQLGYPESTIVGIGLALLLCTALYAIPRTATVGAILLTGYLGGAVATNVRAATPAFNLAFPILFAAAVWGSLILRDNRLARILFEGDNR